MLPWYVDLVLFSNPTDPRTDFGTTAEAAAPQTRLSTLLPPTDPFSQHHFRSASRPVQRVELNLASIRNSGRCPGYSRRVQERSQGPLRTARRGQVVPRVWVSHSIPSLQLQSDWFHSKPTALDALVFAYLHSVLSSSHQIRLEVTHLANLVVWHRRVLHTIQPCFVSH